MLIPIATKPPASRQPSSVLTQAGKKAPSPRRVPSSDFMPAFNFASLFLCQMVSSSLQEVEFTNFSAGLHLHVSDFFPPIRSIISGLQNRTLPASSQYFKPVEIKSVSAVS